MRSIFTRLLAVAAPLSLCSTTSLAQLVPGHVYINEPPEGTITDITSGGNFTSAPPFAFGLVQNAGLCFGPGSALYVTSNGNVIDASAGGYQGMAMPFATEVAIHEPPSTGDCGRLESPSLTVMLSSGRPSMSAATCAMIV